MNNVVTLTPIFFKFIKSVYCKAFRIFIENYAKKDNITNYSKFFNGLKFFYFFLRSFLLLLVWVTLSQLIWILKRHIKWHLIRHHRIHGIHMIHHRLVVWLTLRISIGRLRTSFFPTLIQTSMINS